MITITVHRGELLQIKRMVVHSKYSKKSQLKGGVYGLYTESDQPVIQIVCGNDEDTEDKGSGSCYEELTNGHGLLKLGEWVAPRSDKDDILSDKGITLMFNEKDEKFLAFDNEGYEATLDILKGQSAFRTFKPLTDTLKQITRSDQSEISTEECDKKDDEPKEVQHEAQVTTKQWYSSPEGVAVLQGIYKNLPEFGFQILNLSRDKTTEDISIFLASGDMQFAVYFPPSFPSSDPHVSINNESWSNLHLQKNGDSVQVERSASVLCASLYELVKEKEKEKEKIQKTTKSNKVSKKEKKKQKKKKGEPCQEPPCQEPPCQEPPSQEPPKEEQTKEEQTKEEQTKEEQTKEGQTKEGQTEEQLSAQQIAREKQVIRDKQLREEPSSEEPPREEPSKEEPKDNPDKDDTEPAFDEKNEQMLGSSKPVEQMTLHTTPSNKQDIETPNAEEHEQQNKQQISEAVIYIDEDIEDNANCNREIGDDHMEVDESGDQTSTTKF